MHREIYFRGWLNELIAKITAPDLARDVAGSELQLAVHAEYKKELEARTESLDDFVKDGRELIDGGHFLAEEIQEKLQTLSQRRELLLDTWKRRQEVYEQNCDAQKFERDAAQLEAWLLSRDKLLLQDDLGASIVEVDDLIRRHDDFQKTLEAQDEKANALKRSTLVNYH